MKILIFVIAHILLPYGAQAQSACGALFRGNEPLVRLDQFHRLENIERDGAPSIYRIQIEGFEGLVSGHFPGNVILPGAFILELGKRAIMSHIQDLDQTWQLAEISNSKFTGMARPRKGKYLDFQVTPLKVTSDPGLGRWRVKAVDDEGQVIMYSNYTFKRERGPIKMNENSLFWGVEGGAPFIKLNLPNAFIPQKDGMILIDWIRAPRLEPQGLESLFEVVHQGVEQESISNIRVRDLFVEYNPNEKVFSLIDTMLVESVAQTAIGLVSLRVNSRFSVLLTSVSTAIFYGSLPVGQTAIIKVEALSDLRVEDEGKRIYSMLFKGTVSTQGKVIAEIQLKGRFQINE